MTGFPLRYVEGNLLVGPREERAALYRLETVSYRYLPRRDKELWFSRLAQFAFAVEADFSLWRVGRAYPVERYLERAPALADERHARLPAWGAYLDTHEPALRSLQAQVPEVYIAISLARPELGFGSGLVRAADRARRSLEERFGLAGPKPLHDSELGALAAAEERLFARLGAILPLRRATLRELEWLLRRAPLRGCAEPSPERWWQPNALVVTSERGARSYDPLETDVFRLDAAVVLEEERALVLDSEHSRSYQAFLALGALPEEASFPGPRAELLSAPLEALEFPVDAALHARWIGNREAVGRVRRRILDADDVYAQEAEARQGASWSADENRGLARELHAYLDSEARPPLLHAAISLALGAPSEQALEERIERLRARFGTVELYRPLGLQRSLYLEHLPRADAGSIWDYGDYLTVDQFGALMPLASQHVGQENGAYIGTTSAGSARPVLFDTAAAARESRPPSILLAGTLGSGKTIAAELLALQTALRGGLVVDIDPKPDHNLERVPALAGQVSVIELSGEERFRGLLDPLRIAPPLLREELANSFLIELLPKGPASWETHIRRAVRDALRRERPRSLDVLELLGKAEHPDARDAGDALAVWADAGLGRLAFGSDTEAEPVAGRPVTTIKAGALSLPAPGTPRSDYAPNERLGVAVLKLVAAYALRLVSGDRTRTKLLLFDEAWLLLASSEGRRLLDRLNRLGRAENATLLLATQQLADVGELENLIGARFIFGQETVAEASRALTLLGLDPNDRELIQRLRSYRRGRCLLRDIDDRIAEVQIDLADPKLLALLETTPGRSPERSPVTA
ncbi:MAG TPA: ATP-binding protein [Gaiellaceae bacterium]